MRPCPDRQVDKVAHVVVDVVVLGPPECLADLNIKRFSKKRVDTVYGNISFNRSVAHADAVIIATRAGRTLAGAAQACVSMSSPSAVTPNSHSLMVRPQLSMLADNRLASDAPDLAIPDV